MQAGRKSTGRTIEVYDLLPPEPTSRREPVRINRPVLVEDAVFEVVPVRPRREHNDNPARDASAKRFDLMRLAAVAGVYLVNRLERLLSGLSTQSFATLIASLFLIMFWFCGGFSALGSQPVAAPRSPFVIERVFTEEVDENGMRLLAVGGMLMNHSDATLPVPDLSVVGEGGEMIGAIAPATPELAAGQSVRFFSRFQLSGGKSGAVTIFPATKCCDSGGAVLTTGFRSHGVLGQMHVIRGKKIEQLFTAEMIAKRMDELASEIATGPTKDLLVIAVLKGSFIFAADLIRSLHHVGLAPEVEFITLSSYGTGTTSKGVRIVKDIDSAVKDRDVLLIDDILESGRTLTFARDLLMERGARHVSIAVLLDKHDKRQTSMEADHVGFVCPDHFVVGYGMDVAYAFRELPFVGVVTGDA